MLLNFGAGCHAQEAKKYVISISQMPILAESVDKGIFVELIKEVARDQNIDIQIQLSSFKRSLLSPEKGETDIHLPFIYSQDLYDSHIRYSSFKLYSVQFSLFTRQGDEIYKNNLKGHSIETDLAHQMVIPEANSFSTCIPCSLKKLSTGRIDAFIYAQGVVQRALEKSAITNIRSEPYKIFEVRAVLTKGPRGQEIDQLISKGLENLVENGLYFEIMRPLLQYGNIGLQAREHRPN